MSNLNKSLKIVNSRKKYFTQKQRQTPANLNILNDSLVRSVNTVKTQYKLSLNEEKKYNPSQDIKVCNLKKAFRYESKLKYLINKKCCDYDSPDVKKYLLNRLYAPIHISKIIAPKQIDGNCWFNAMFMMFFVSDKGRIFFQYLRRLMIEGDSHKELSDVFALLNFIVECCLSGNSIAKLLNTNKIIKKIYDLIVGTGKHMSIPNVGEAGNPIVYYKALVQYLGNNALNIAFVSLNWKKQLHQHSTPHVIVISNSPDYRTKKPLRFSLNNHVYELDSASVIDNDGTHFCAVVTCNGVEFAFDGYSNARLIPFEWKTKINENIDWNFKDNIYEFQSDILWNFTKGYSEFCYYRKT